MRTLDKARKYAYLSELSTPQLEKILRADMASSEDNIDMVLYIMEVIEQREGGKSPENIADTERAREEFYRIYNIPECTGQSLYVSENQDRLALSDETQEPETITILADSTHKSAIRSHKFHRVKRISLIAAITVVVMLGVMAVAQAAGLDVFGAVARWTDKVFSLGTIRYDSAIDKENDTISQQMTVDENISENAEYASIQEALDVCNITEVAAPTWVPEGYSFEGIDVLYKPDGSFLILSGGYRNGTATLNIAIEYYDYEPHTQIEKTGAPVETFTVNDITVYLLENINSNVATWATEHYAYYINGDVGKDELRKISISAINGAK